MPIAPYRIDENSTAEVSKREDGLMFDPNFTDVNSDIGNCCRWNWKCYEFIVQHAVELVSNNVDLLTHEIFLCCWDRYRRSCHNPSPFEKLVVEPPPTCANP